MTHTSSRRTFLNAARRRSRPGRPPLALVPAQLWAIEPIERHGGPKFKFSVAAYSYRDLLNGKTAETQLDDFIDDCANMQLEGTELTSYYFPPDVDPDYLRQIKNLTFRLGLDISGTAVGNDFCHPAGPKRDEQIALVKRWIDYAEILGAPVIRIFSGMPHGTSREEAHRLAVAGIEECCQYAGQHGIYLALENHGGLTATADEMLEIVRDVKSPWFGVNLDTGNFHSADFYGEMAQVGPLRRQRAGQGFGLGAGRQAGAGRFQPAGQDPLGGRTTAATSCWSWKSRAIRGRSARSSSISFARRFCG